VSIDLLISFLDVSATSFETPLFNTSSISKDGRLFSLPPKKSSLSNSILLGFNALKVVAIVLLPNPLGATNKLGKFACNSSNFNSYKSLPFTFSIFIL